jgi:large subunit ribosomal protein L13
MKIKTYSPKKDDIQREWFVVDAKDQTLGRLATQVATLLRGKHKPIYAPHMDVGDFVIVINADKIRVTGNKLDQKIYYRHSGYPGGLRSRTLRELQARFPDRVIRLAVRGMLPKNRLGRATIKKLKIYAGDKHPHQAQQPKAYELKY